jgi:hypothetical protein
MTGQFQFISIDALNKVKKKRSNKALGSLSPCEAVAGEQTTATTTLQQHLSQSNW